MPEIHVSIVTDYPHMFEEGCDIFSPHGFLIGVSQGQVA